MSYSIEPMELITFVEDNKLKLPRFQRKSTWDKNQNFELAISVFQNYPVGVVIINREQNSSWLLDGRQRRAALLTMRENPVELYEWGRSYLKFSKTADELEVTRHYWEKVERYLTEEPTEKKKDKNNGEESEEYTEDIEVIEDFSSETGQNSFDSHKQRDGLKVLLSIILMVHQNKPSGSRWEKLFDFTSLIPRLRYAPQKNNSKIDPKMLRRFLIDLISDWNKENDGIPSKEFFVDYYIQNFVVDDEQKFGNEVEKHWEDISKSLEVIDKSEKVFKEARIGVIWLTNASPLDAQNIFSRINDGGTPLKAEELLSAKPYWNKAVNVSNTSVVEKVKDMYRKLGVSAPEGVVRWDVAATLISRIKDNHLIFDPYEASKKNNEIDMDEVTLGFKLLSSVYVQGMSSIHVNELEKKEDSIKWDSDIDTLIDELNTVCHILQDDTFFKFYLSWKKPVAKLLGNAIALEFLTIVWLDWKKKGCPYTVSAHSKAVQRDARILFDKLIFEYATRTWRGSGDSKMSYDIKNWEKRIVAVEAADWKNFVVQACSGNYNGQRTTKKVLTPVLYYYYSIKHLSPGNSIDIGIDVDHIMPEEKFKDNAMVDQALKESLINFALLPKKDNIKKGSKALNEITNDWLKQQIETYEEIERKDFDLFSDITKIGKLQDHRKALFLEAFDSKRSSLLAN